MSNLSWMGRRRLCFFCFYFSQSLIFYGVRDAAPFFPFFPREGVRLVLFCFFLIVSLYRNGTSHITISTLGQFLACLLH